MIHCFSCYKYPYDSKVIPYKSEFPTDTFRVYLISKNLPNSFVITSNDVEELPNNCKFAVGSKLFVVNGNDGSEVYAWDSEKFTLIDINVDSDKDEGGDISPSGEILDSWDTIIANIDNKTYSTKYKIGNYKPLDLGTEGTINMQIVAMDADELADGSGYAPLTFIGMELLNNKHAFSDNTDNYMWTDGSSRNGIRTYLQNTIFDLIPSNVRNRVQKIHKVSYMNTSEGVTTDTLFIPSDREIFGFTESFGVGQYVPLKLPANRIRKIKGTNTPWWGRSRYQNKNYYVDVNGNLASFTTGSGLLGICLGFCLG